jgi:hypothetical protein
MVTYGVVAEYSLANACETDEEARSWIGGSKTCKRNLTYIRTAATNVATNATPNATHRGRINRNALFMQGSGGSFCHMARLVQWIL